MLMLSVFVIIQAVSSSYLYSWVWFGSRFHL